MYTENSHSLGRYLAAILLLIFLPFAMGAKENLFNFTSAKGLKIKILKNDLMRFSHAELIIFHGDKNINPAIPILTLENMFNKDFLDTESYINFLKKSFKKGVYVYRFEDMKKNYSVWIKDLCDFIGCDVPKIERKKHNVGWGKNRIKIALFFNKFFKSPVNPEKGFFTWREWHSPRKILDTLWLLAPKKKSSKKNKPRENI